MAAPNIISANTVIGKTVGANLTSNTTTTVLNNPANSNKCFKVNTLNISNVSGSTVAVNIYYNNSANLGGTNYNIVGNVSVPSGATLNVIDKTSQYYLEENTSLGAQAATANSINVTVSYEDIS